MRLLRIGVLLAVLAALGVGVVHLRSEQARAASRALNLELKKVEIRRDLWRTQASIARLRTPDQIRGRLGRVELPLAPPGASR